MHCQVSLNCFYEIESFNWIHKNYIQQISRNVNKDPWLKIIWKLYCIKQLRRAVKFYTQSLARISGFVENTRIYTRGALSRRISYTVVYTIVDPLRISVSECRLYSLFYFLRFYLFLKIGLPHFVLDSVFILMSFLARHTYTIFYLDTYKYNKMYLFILSYCIKF